MVGKADRAIDDEQHHFRAVDRTQRTHISVVLDIFIDHALATKPRRVDDRVVASFVLDRGIDRIARSACHIRNDRTIIIGELIGKRRLACVRSSDDGNVDRIDPIVLFFGWLRETLHHFIEKIARSRSMER